MNPLAFCRALGFDARMPAFSDHDQTREILGPFLRAHYPRTIHLLNLLNHGFFEEARAFPLDKPRAALIRPKKSYYYYATDCESGARLLEEVKDVFRKPVSFAAMSETLVESVEKFAPIDRSDPCDLFYLENPSERFEEFRPAERNHPNLFDLKYEDIPTILKHWPYGSPDDADDVARLQQSIDNWPCVGWREDGRLISWALTNNDGSHGLAHTIEPYRRQGKFSAVGRELLLQTLELGRDAFGFIVVGNSKPRGIVNRSPLTQVQGRYLWLTTRPVQ